MEIQEIPFKHEKTLFYYESDWMLEEIVQRCCGISILGDVQKRPCHSTKQTDLDGSSLSREEQIKWSWAVPSDLTDSVKTEVLFWQ